MSGRHSLLGRVGISIALVALLIGALGAGQALAAHHKGKHKHHPAGAIKLPGSKVKHVHGLVCGELGHSWASGKVVAGYFLADSTQAAHYKALAKHAKGKAKVRDTALAKQYAAKAKAGKATCNGSGGKGGGHHGTTNPGGRGRPAPNPGGSGNPAPNPGGSGNPAPLRFDVNGAVGLALSSGTGGSTNSVRGVRRALATSSTETGSGSNLEAVNEAGQVSDAISSGTAAVSSFLIAPNEKLYVMFSYPVDLEDTTKYVQPGTGCVLAQVDPSSGVPTCIDDTLAFVAGGSSSGSETGDPSPGVQFDNSGAIYYLGSTTGGEVVLRKWSNGTSTDLIPPSAVLISSWLALPDGTVLISGTTLANNQWWFREVSPAGSLRELPVLATREGWLVPFPDGNAYFGASDPNNASFGVDYYDVSAHEVASKWWIGNQYQPPGGVTNNVHEAICTGLGVTVTQLQAINFCQDAGIGVKWHFATNEGKEFVLAWGVVGQGVPMEYYPTVEFLPTKKIENVTIAQGVINNLLLAGTNSKREQVLTLFNTSNETEQELLPGSTGDHFEIYHLNYVVKGNKILFDGLRFSDNHYVIGEYDLSTHTVKVVATSTVKWSDLQSF